MDLERKEIEGIPADGGAAGAARRVVLCMIETITLLAIYSVADVLRLRESPYFSRGRTSI